VKSQRFKAVIKNGKPTGQVRQTNSGTSAKTQAVHALIKKAKG
jgi:hypothetical protein